MDYAAYIGARDGKRYLLNSSGDTADIMGAILDADKQAAHYTANLAPVLRGNSQYQTCYNLWSFWKQHVQYKEDPEGYQFIKSPRELFHSGFGDCKSYSVAVASCLKNLGIPYVYRFTTETPGKDFHHVYIVAKTAQGPVIIDCVLDEFNRENRYVQHKDIAGNGGRIGAVTARPFGSKTKVVKIKVAGIGANNADEDIYAVVPEPGFWANEAEDIKKNFLTYAKENQRSLVTGIRFAWANKPLIRNKLANSVYDEYKNLLNTAFGMAYKYWTGPAPLPPELQSKKELGERLHSRLKDMGCRDGDLQILCSLSVFNVYGVSLEYMNYRSQNILKYGQAWTPKYGVPYWNVKTGVLNANGAPLSTAIGIGLCLPAGGGFSRPWKEPYWAVGGWVMLNGAPESQLEYFIANNPRPANTQQNINDQARLQSIALYDQWRENNIPGLPLPPWMQGSKPKIGRTHKIGDGGLSAAAIGAIIGTVVSAIIAIATAIAKIIKDSKGLDVTDKNVPEYLTDGLDNPAWTTVSGKYMFYNPATGQYTLCDTATGQNCVAADPNDPNNAPAMGNFGGLGGSSTWLLIGGLALLAFAFLSGGSSRKPAA